MMILWLNKNKKNALLVPAVLALALLLLKSEPQFCFFVPVSAFSLHSQSSPSLHLRRRHPSNSRIFVTKTTPSLPPSPLEEEHRQKMRLPASVRRKKNGALFKTSSSNLAKTKNKSVANNNNNIEEDMIFCQRVEEQVAQALTSLTQAVQDQTNKNTTATSSTAAVYHGYLFPTVRECNRALGILGRIDLLRALRLFGKMRKAAALEQKHHQQHHHQRLLVIVPTPSLVTYSVLMARAVKAGKVRVALRLWKLMQEQQQQQHSSASSGLESSSSSSSLIVPDVKAANILMNCYAKLALVERAQDLLSQMQTGCGPDICLAVTPNLVTYNTLLDTCLKAGDLDAALQAKQELLSQQQPAGPRIRPDERTYTSLIATVARQPSRSAGRNDPSLAFELLQEMIQAGIEPNGKTYSALIDVAGRCRRSDLALQGLRIMLRQKKKKQQPSHNNDQENVLENEVGAWTAAINACGKAGRLETAIRLFYVMDTNFGVAPNTVTCGCLTDMLIKAGRTAETVKVLRYMKEKGIVPSEVMYTSLMTRAERLVQMERTGRQRQQQQRQHNHHHHWRPEEKSSEDKDSLSASSTATDNMKAIEVYTELMKSLMEVGRSSNNSKSEAPNYKRKQQLPDSNTLLMKVFLVFQEMKAAGAQPDLACFNALLRACARSGDISRAQNVLHDMHASGLHPNDASWRQLLQAASVARRGDVAVSVWKQGLAYHHHHYQNRQRQSPGISRRQVDAPLMQWIPSVESFATLLTAFLRQASNNKETLEKRIYCYECCLELYNDLLLGSEDMGMHRMDPNHVLDSQRTMLLVLESMVALVDYHEGMANQRQREDVCKMTASILELDCFQHVELNRLSWASARVYQKARSWTATTRNTTDDRIVHP